MKYLNTLFALTLLLTLGALTGAPAIFGLQIAVATLAAVHFGNIGVFGFRWLATNGLTPNEPRPSRSAPEYTRIAADALHAFAREHGPSCCSPGVQLDPSPAIDAPAAVPSKLQQADALIGALTPEYTRVNSDALRAFSREHSQCYSSPVDQDALRGFVAGGPKGSQGNDPLYRGG